MILFSAIYNFGATDIAHRAFTLCVLPAMLVGPLKEIHLRVRIDVVEP